MYKPAQVYPIPCAFQNFHTYAYYIDAPEPVIIDTGVAGSVDDFIMPALTGIGRDLRDVKWVFLTHGHLDHIGGASSIKDITGGKARIAIHASDADMLRSQQAIENSSAKILETYTGGQGMQLIRDSLPTVISGQLEPDLVLNGGEVFDLGNGNHLHAIHTPGHSSGSITYWLEGSKTAFTGDAVQLSGGVHTQFPSYENPQDYRTSLREILHLEAETVHMGHPYKFPDAGVIGPQIADVPTAIEASLELESRIANAFSKRQEAFEENTSSDQDLYHPFSAIARELNYQQDPTRFPAPFFITLNGYLEESRSAAADSRK